MIRLFLPFLFGFSLLLTTSLSAQKPVEKSYYPISEGNKWHYLIKAEGQPERKLTNQIAKIEMIDGESLARLETVINGNVAASEHLQITEKGLFRKRFNGTEINPPICLLKFPIKDGEKWESNTKIGAIELKVKCNLEFEEAVVPAGKFKCAKVHVETEQKGANIITTYWFAPELGMVKQYVDINSKAFSVQLEKFESSKP